MAYLFGAAVGSAYTKQDVSTNYTASSLDYFISASNGITVTLYPLVNFDNGSQGLTIKNTGTTNITVQADGAETINGSNTLTIRPGDSRWLIPNTTEWTIN